jgi:nucleotide-binding universal stress UspA family protein
MHTRILVAYDGSDGAHAALRSAVALAAASGGTIHLVHSTGHLEDADQGVVEEGSGAESRAVNALDQAVDQLEDVEASMRVVRGDPVAGIIAAAEGIHADLIVTGSRGRAMVAEAILGRVSSGVVSSSPCDVLVVQPRPRL